MKRKLLVSVGLVVCLLMVLAVSPPAPSAEAKEKLASSVRGYLGTSPDGNAVIAGFIKEKLGVELKSQLMSGGEIRARLTAEAPNFNTDIAASGSVEAILAIKEGWAAPYDSPTWRGAGSFKDRGNGWFSIGKVPFVLVANKDLLAKKGYTLPKSWDDLLDPKWKGQIVMPSTAASSTAFMMTYSFMALYGFNKGKGEAGGWEYLEGLDKNIVFYTRSGNAPTDLVARGEFMLGIAAPQNVAARIKEGYPLVVANLKEGTGHLNFSWFIVKGSPVERTCQKVIDLLGTADFGRLWGPFAGQVTKEPSAPPPRIYPGKIKWIPNVDAGWAFENKKRLIDEWERRFVLKQQKKK